MAHLGLTGKLRRARKVFRLAPPGLKVSVVGAIAVLLFLAVNWLYHVVRKPAELFFPVSGTLNKTPLQTWQHYEAIFRAHATPVMSAELLAALAQVEVAGNPVATSYWRWQPAWNPLHWYRPASSAVGMYQITDGTFEQAKRLCIRGGEVTQEGAWYDARACWFNSLYFRVVPSHAVEMTSAYLDRSVSNILSRHRISGATLRQKQQLAALVHLCGASAGDAFARRGFRLVAGQRCGDHDVRRYLAEIEATQRLFR